MILLPEHVDLIFGAPECQTTNNTGLSHTFADRLGGSKGGLKARSDTTARALELATRQSRVGKSATSKRKLATVHSLDEMRQNLKTT